MTYEDLLNFFSDKPEFSEYSTALIWFDRRISGADGEEFRKNPIKFNLLTHYKKQPAAYSDVKKGTVDTYRSRLNKGYQLINYNFERHTDPSSSEDIGKISVIQNSDWAATLDPEKGEFILRFGSSLKSKNLAKKFLFLAAEEAL